MDGREGQEAGQAGRGRAAIDPGQLEGCQREGQVLGAGDEAAFFRLHEGGGDAGAVEGFEHLVLAGRPLVGVALAGGHQARHGSARHAARRLHQHLQVEAVGKAPLNLADRVAGEGEHGFWFGDRSGGHRRVLKQRAYCRRPGTGWLVTRITSAGEGVLCKGWERLGKSSQIGESLDG